MQNAGSTFKPTVVEGFAGGQPTASAGGGGAGGGAGGGVIELVYLGSYTNNGTVQATGGAGGVGGSGDNYTEAGGSGTSGSAGTIITQKI